MRGRDSRAGAGEGERETSVSSRNGEGDVYGRKREREPLQTDFYESHVSLKTEREYTVASV